MTLESLQQQVDTATHRLTSLLMNGNTEQPQQVEIRVALTQAMIASCDIQALAQLLREKGLFTPEEYAAASLKAMRARCDSLTSGGSIIAPPTVSARRQNGG